MRRVALIALALPALLAGAWGNGYTYRTTAVIASGQISGTLTNWTGVISLSSVNLKTVANGGSVQNTCTQSGTNSLTIPADFLVTSDSAGSTQIAGVEFETYSASAGTALMWVNVASAAVGSTVYAFYDNSSVSTCQGTPTSAVDGNTTGVWHLPNGSTLSAYDSTGNYNGTLAGSPSAVAGKVDGAGSFNGSSGYVEIAGLTTLSGNVTASAWVYPTISNAFQSIFSQGGASSRNLEFMLSSSGVSKIYTEVHGNNCGGDQSISTSWATNAWNHLAITFDATNMIIYLNGAAVFTVACTFVPYNGIVYPASFGADYGAGPGFYLNGYEDEVRLASVARSAAWIGADYNNQSAPGTFWTLTYDATNGGGAAAPPLRAVIGAGK